MCSYVKVAPDHRSVSIVEYPTVKFPLSNKMQLVQVERILKQKKKKYQISQRNQKQYISITLLEEEAKQDNILIEIITSLSKGIKFQKVSLYEDMKAGVMRIKKIKQEHGKNQYNNNAKGGKYSLQKPPQIFIRKAVDTDDEEVQVQLQNKNQSKIQKKKKYKEAVKPIINNDDFPTLI